MDRKLNRRGLLGVGVSFAALGIAACSQNAPAPTTSSSSSSTTAASSGSKAAPTTSTSSAAAPAATAPSQGAAQEIVFWPRGPSESTVVWERITPIAKKLFPELTVKLQPPPSDFNNKLLVAFAGGTAPDSGVTGLSAFRGFIGKKTFKSIQSYVNADSEVKTSLQQNIDASATDGYGYKGQLYGVPTVSEAIVVFYHKDAIVEAKLTPPREIDSDPQKWNWNTVIDYAKAINKGTGFRRERFGIIATYARNTFGVSQAWGNPSYARGARFLDPDGEKWLYTGTEANEGAQFIVDLTHKYDVQPNVGEAASANILDRAFFQNGQMGMVVEGEYFSRYLWGTGKPSGGIKFNYDICQMPFCPATGKRTNIYHGNGSFLISQSKNPDATWKWLKTIFTLDAQQVISKYWGTRAADKRTYDDWLKSNANGGPDGVNYKAIADADADTYPFPTTPYLTPEALLEPTTRLMYDEVFQNKMAVPAGLDQIAKETTALIAKGKQALGG